MQFQKERTEVNEVQKQSKNWMVFGSERTTKKSSLEVEEIWIILSTYLRVLVAFHL